MTAERRSSLRQKGVMAAATRHAVGVPIIEAHAGPSRSFYATRSTATSMLTTPTRSTESLWRRDAQVVLRRGIGLSGKRAFASEAGSGDGDTTDKVLSSRKSPVASPRDKGQTPAKSERAARFSAQLNKEKGARGKGKQPGLSLEFFLLRGNIVKLFRDFLRASRNIPNPQARRETVDWLRDEHFEGASGLRRQTDVVSRDGWGRLVARALFPVTLLRKFPIGLSCNQTRIRELLVAGNAALKRICGPMELVAALNPEHGSFPKLRGRRSI